MDSTFVDVAIATIFFFVTLSLIISTITDYLTRWLQLRARNFKAGLNELLGADLARKVLDGEFTPPSTRGAVEHMEPHQFALAILHEIGTTRDTLAKAQIPATLKQTLMTFFDAADGQVDKLRTELEAWFDSGMLHVASWFRASAQKVTMVVAAVVVIGLNADTLVLVDRAWNDQTLRAALVGAAGNARESAPQGPPAKPADLAAVKLQIATQLEPFPIGWWNNAPLQYVDIAKKPIGLLITFIATILGAPFWFDLLKRVMMLRSQIEMAKQKQASAAAKP